MSDRFFRGNGSVRGAWLPCSCSSCTGLDVSSLSLQRRLAIRHVQVEGVPQEMLNWSSTWTRRLACQSLLTEVRSRGLRNFETVLPGDRGSWPQVAAGCAEGPEDWSEHFVARGFLVGFLLPSKKPVAMVMLTLRFFKPPFQQWGFIQPPLCS